MRKRIICFCWLAVWLAALLCAPAALGEAAAGTGQPALHRFLELPFETATAEDTARALRERLGAEPVLSADASQLTAVEPVSLYGYAWRLTVYLDTDAAGLERALLTLVPAESVAAVGLQAVIDGDIRAYLAVVDELTALYGAPTSRYMSLMKGDLRGWFYGYPEDGWTAEAMRSLCEGGDFFGPYTVWSNISLRLWVWPGMAVDTDDSVFCPSLQLEVSGYLWADPGGLQPYEP